MLKQFEKNLGAAPGVEHEEIVLQPAGGGEVRITCADFCPERVVIQNVTDLENFLSSHRPKWTTVRWIDVAGLSDLRAIQALAAKYCLHPLAIEDVLHLSQRPKIEVYGENEPEFQVRLFIVAQTVIMKGQGLHSEQVSIFLGHRTVITIQEEPSEVWEPIYQRIRAKGSRLRSSDASFLMYSLLDILIDRCFPLLEHYGDRAEEMEELLLEHSPEITIKDIYTLKRELLLMRRVLWPTREVVSCLLREPYETVSDNTRVYMRDLYDHVVQTIDIIETYREMASDLTETYISTISNRMNEIMKVLTLISTVFIPLTFLAGVYGMNFKYFPEINQMWGYPLFWGVCIVLAVVMFIFFRKRKWM